MNRVLVLLNVALVAFITSGCNSRPADNATETGNPEGQGTTAGISTGTGDNVGTLPERAPDEDDESFARRALDELNANLASRLEELRTSITALPEESRAEAFNKQNPVPEFVEQAMNLARRLPATQAGFEAALAAYGHAEGSKKVSAMDLLIEKCGDRLNHARVVEDLLEQVPGQQIEDWLRKLIESAPKGEAHAETLLAFKNYFDQLPEFRIALRHNPEIAQRLPAEQLEYINADPGEERRNEIAGYLQTAIDQYSDLEYWGGSLAIGKTFGAVAERELFELRNLQPGLTAPDIEGEDLDGAPFRLSDYRGKVVMLDFWGHWCPPCRRMYPHERHIVSTLTNFPFALVGVNSDPKLETARKAVEDDNLPWRNFWNGSEGTSGPIAREWNVTAWPTIYLIDGEGVIRYKGLQGEDLNRAIETLMAEMGHQVELSHEVLPSGG